MQNTVNILAALGVMAERRLFLMEEAARMKLGDIIHVQQRDSKWHEAEIVHLPSNPNFQMIGVRLLKGRRWVRAVDRKKVRT